MGIDRGSVPVPVRAVVWVRRRRLVVVCRVRVAHRSRGPRRRRPRATRSSMANTRRIQGDPASAPLRLRQPAAPSAGRASSIPTPRSPLRAARNRLVPPETTRVILGKGRIHRRRTIARLVHRWRTRTPRRLRPAAVNGPRTRGTSQGPLRRLRPIPSNLRPIPLSLTRRTRIRPPAYSETPSGSSSHTTGSANADGLKSLSGTTTDSSALGATPNGMSETDSAATHGSAKPDVHVVSPAGHAADSAPTPETATRPMPDDRRGLDGLPTEVSSAATVVRVSQEPGANAPSADSVRAQTTPGTPSSAPVVVAPATGSGDAVVVSSKQAKGLAQELGRDVIALVPGRGRRGRRWMRFPATGGATAVRGRWSADHHARDQHRGSGPIGPGLAGEKCCGSSGNRRKDCCRGTRVRDIRGQGRTDRGTNGQCHVRRWSRAP